VPVDTTIPADLITTEGKTADDIPFETPVEFGRSVQDRPLVLERLGTAGGARVLVVGVIHGNEQAGLEITALLRTMELGTNIDLAGDVDEPRSGWRPTPARTRAVDLNRNFTVNWGAIGTKGDWQYAGPSAASEPETQAMMTLARMVEPDLVIWYHQDYFRIEPKAGREGEIRSRYAGLVDLPLLPISGGSYSGTANGWVRTVIATRGMSMTVELGPELRAGEAQAHAEAVLTIVDEYWTEGGSPPSSAMP
jgi:protein MpaA